MSGLRERGWWSSMPPLTETFESSQAPLANALLSVGGSSSGWRLGFHSSSAQHHAVDAQRSSAANGDGQPQQQQDEETVDATASMTPEQVMEAYREAQEALEAERKRVSSGRPALTLAAGHHLDFGDPDQPRRLPCLSLGVNVAGR